VASRLATGVEGFDDLIAGGFLPGSTNLLSGPSGSGKTLFSLMYAYTGAVGGDPAIYVALEEPRSSLLTAMAGMGLDPKPLEQKGLLTFLDLGEMRKLSEGDEFVSFSRLESLLEGMVGPGKHARLVVDSLAVVGLNYRSPREFRRELFKFGRYLNEAGVTSLLVTEKPEGGELTRFGVEQHIADSFIILQLERRKGEMIRSVVVRKMRFTNHDIALHPFLITAKGLKVSGDVRLLEGEDGRSRD